MSYIYKRIHVLLLFCFSISLNAQTGIDTRTPNSSAAVDINATNKGFLITRVPLLSRSDVTTVSSPPTGMLVIASQNSATIISENDKVTQGILYKFNGEQWEEIIEEEKPSVGLIAPEIVAYGKKTIILILLV